jgi:hypothetical protein
MHLKILSIVTLFIVLLLFLGTPNQMGVKTKTCEGYYNCVDCQSNWCNWCAFPPTEQPSCHSAPPVQYTFTNCHVIADGFVSTIGYPSSWNPTFPYNGYLLEFLAWPHDISGEWLRITILDNNGTLLWSASPKVLKVGYIDIYKPTGYFNYWESILKKHISINVSCEDVTIFANHIDDIFSGGTKIFTIQQQQQIIQNQIKTLHRMEGSIVILNQNLV